MNSIGVNGPVSVSSGGAGRAGRRRACAVSRSPAARLPIWSWFWLQTDEPPGRHAPRCRSARRGRGRGTTSTCRRGRSPCSQHLRERRQRLEVGVVAVGLAGQRDVQRRGGSRRSTARRARSRRPPAGVISRGSLRSDSAISVSGRPQVRRQRGDLDRPSPPAGGSARVSASACTASSRSPSTW